MELKNSLILIPLFFCFASFAKSKLPVLKTKQDINNIRYITSDGKFTYYQRGNGSLQFSTNYSVEEVIKFEPNTHYKITEGHSQKYLAVEVNQKYHQYLSIKNRNDIYSIKFGTNEINKVGQGMVTGVHLDDNWFSIFDPLKRNLIIQNHRNPSLKYEVKIANKLNPYFIPQVIMLDEDTVIYTDINKDGFAGILKFELNAKKLTLLHKANSKLKSLEICYQESGEIFLTTKGYDPIERGTSIELIDKKKLNFDKPTLLYQSEENDIGNVTCAVKDDTLFFVKTLRSQTGKLTYEASEFTVSTKKEKIISDIKFASNLFTMDNKVILPYQNKYFVIYGESNLTQFDTLKDQEIEATVE